MHKRFGPIVLVLLLSALAAGCATTQVSAPAQPVQQLDTAMASAAALARNEAALTSQERALNARQINQLLAGVDNATLARDAAQLPPGDPLYPYVGRALLNRGLPLPRPFERGEQWSAGMAARPAAELDGYRPPLKLAVLLPLSGRLATAAAPVRDGLLAGYYGETRRRPEIDFIDTAGTAAGAQAAYSRAIASGADFVLGPLGRDEVSALFGGSNLSVPVLALNRGNDEAPPPGHAGFSLAPEDDGIIAAEYLLGLERRNVLVLAGNDDNARRAANAFRERFSERGGNVVQTISVSDQPDGLAATLAPLAQQQVDGVFLSLRGNVARAVAPQLALSGLGGSSRVGTSQLTLGTGTPEQDTALDGIVFPTEAWTAGGVRGLPSAGMVGSQMATARGPAARLFAFGYDAWLLTAYLERLATVADAELPGATGRLRLDGFGNVVRTPVWSTFSGGRTTPIAGGG